jgi:AmiR/NasT family two-component response regulator
MMTQSRRPLMPWGVSAHIADGLSQRRMKPSLIWQSRRFLGIFTVAKRIARDALSERTIVDTAKLFDREAEDQ